MDHSSTSAEGGRETALLRAFGAVLLLLALVVRFAMLGRWPAVQADEGLWTNSTKNFAQFGDWFMDGRTHLLLSPVYHLATLPVFKVLGASIASARFVSVVAGLLCIWLLYRIVSNLTRDWTLAATAALVFALDQWTVFIARSALIESTQLAPILLAAWLGLRRDLASAAVAGVAMAVALLTKLNAAFILPIFAVYFILQGRTEPRTSLRTTMIRLIVFFGVAVGLAAAAYRLEYSFQAERFASAFRFELDGAHFEGLSHPILRVGRFGIDPALMARTAIDLFRESPFLLVLGTFGLVLELVRRPFRPSFFALWFVGGAAFFFLQTFQPTRYFFLLTPAIAFYAACALKRLSTGSVGAAAAQQLSGLATLAALATCVAFNVAYIAGGFLANTERRLPAVVQWVNQHTQPTDRIMTAAYFATDLKRRTYAHYNYSGTESALVGAVQELGIDYIIDDDQEWSADQRQWLARHYAVVQKWPFGDVYRVGPLTIQAVATLKPR